MKRLKAPALWIILGVVAVAGVWPLLNRSATLREDMFLILMFVTLASSLNILLGYTGYVNFGHIVFFGLGGYIGFYLIAQQEWHLIPAALMAALVTTLLAVLIGGAVLRLRGAYFALATLGINEATRAFVTNFKPFGEATGLSLHFSRYQEYGGPANALWFAYTLLVVVTLATLLVSYLVKTSKFGLGLMAIREDEDAAMVLGIPAPRAKTIAFALSAFFPAIVGTLFFFKNGNIEPGDAFRLHMSIEGIVMIMLGGFGTVTGPVIGSAVYERLRSYLLTTPLFKDLQLFFAGMLLLIIILFVPSGLIGWLRERSARLREVLQ
ncbi:MAG: branched-chain amino acid ABC transporter permease [Chloroflexi bacterium]|nr:MAG: branched-chain amino acid ABC transporter permease [Chloroflexota bacterium]